ncbi:MAG: T9SS type A sorting domain-containing protein [Bacteroidales bacterium]
MTEHWDMRNVLRMTAAIAGLICLCPLPAQEIITPLYRPLADPSLRKSVSSAQAVLAEDTLDLPFVEDFSTDQTTPDPTRWAPSDALVNRSYGVNPWSVGVATLDALNSEGSVYAHATLSPIPFEADSLSSLPIDLNLPASDSVYLSFLYQPQGRGERPDAWDSLLLDFYDPSQKLWTCVWGAPGDTLRDFRQVLVPVTDPGHLQRGFRFRFRNLASLPKNSDYADLRSNVDHWNLDYIRLDKNRHRADTIIRDLAFSAPLPTFLTHYTAFPWSTYEAARSKLEESIVTATYRNNDAITRNVTRSFLVRNLLTGDVETPSDPTAMDLEGHAATTVEFAYLFPLDYGVGDSVVLQLEAALRSDDFDLIKGNDTIRRTQVLSDHFAYDDGIPEAGYGLRGDGTSNGYVAQEFNSYDPLTLAGVDLYFNQVYDSLNLDYFFKLLVWNDDEGLPGTVLHDDENDCSVQYSSTYPGFKRFLFSSPVEVNGVFHVGWMQYNKFLLNVGLDKNNPVPGVLSYNFQGEWVPSAAPGVLLLRPFLATGTSAAPGPPAVEANLRVYPNPAGYQVRLGLPEGGPISGSRVEVFDIQGRRVLFRELLDDGLDISGLPEGVYVLRLHVNERTYRQKLLISR